LLAIPMGQLADRVGRGRVFVGGYLVLLSVYGLLLLPWYGAAQVIIYLVLLGVYYAATDGVLMAIGSMLLPEDLRSSGLALLSTVTNVGRLVASILFGLLWSWQGMSVAVGVFIFVLALATIAAARLVMTSGFGATTDGA